MGYLILVLLGVGFLAMSGSKGSATTPTLFTPGIWDGMSAAHKSDAVTIMQALGVNPETGLLIPGMKIDPAVIREAYKWVVTFRDKGYTQAATVIENYANTRNAEYLSGGYATPTVKTPGLFEDLPEPLRGQTIAILQALGVNGETGALIPGYKVSPDVIKAAYSFVTVLQNAHAQEAATVVANYANTRNSEYMSGGWKNS